MRNVSSGNIYYCEEDMLGSSRTIVQSGATSPCYDADFLPVGYEKQVTNTCSQSYKFEGKERDTETSNDDFGARYYSNRFGRWLSADWSAVPAPVPYANLTNPQTLNLYAMVSDNPESFADLTGHDPTKQTGPVQDCGGSGCTAVNPNDPACADNQAVCGSENVADFSHTLTTGNTNAPSDPAKSQQKADDLQKAQAENERKRAAQDAISTDPLGDSIIGFFAGAVVGTVDAAASAIGDLFGGSAGEATSGSASSALSGVQANKAAGDAFRDEVADTLKSAGRDVEKEVTKRTPFSRRVVDIEVKQNGKTLGGVETKVGGRVTYQASVRRMHTSRRRVI